MMVHATERGWFNPRTCPSSCVRSAAIRTRFSMGRRRFFGPLTTMYAPRWRPTEACAAENERPIRMVTCAFRGLVTRTNLIRMPARFQARVAAFSDQSNDGGSVEW